MVVKLNLDPGEYKLTLKIRRYDNKRWIISAFKSDPEKPDSFSGSLVMEEADAVPIVKALTGIDPSFQIRLDGDYQFFRETDRMHKRQE